MPEICLCFNCMKQYKKEYGMCPFCGYQNEQAETEPIHLSPGTMLQGKYLVGKSIGHGGFSVTYVGLDTVLDVRVAIKEYMPSEYATRSGHSLSLTISQQGDAPQRYKEGMEKFVEEARRLAAIDNVEGIVKVFDAFVENNTAYIVMEYLEGETLSEKLRKEGPMEPKKAFVLLLPLMDSLERVHKAGILHRDISPDNVIYTSSGAIKLIDFGSARYVSKEKSMSVFIKPGYTPAEQYSSDGNQGTWTDVYALAATIYKMITGVTPPDGIQRKSKDSLQPVSKQGIKISPSAENALLNAMNVSIEKRTKTVEEFKNQLYSTKEVKRVVESGSSGNKAVKITAIVVASVVVVLAATIGILIASGVFVKDVTYTNGEYSLNEGETLVPRFISSTMDDAGKKADEFDLILQANDADFSTDVPMDKILAQNPDAGVRVNKGTKVNVTLSAGPKMYLMPKVRGLSLEDAEKKLKENGFDTETRTAESVYAKGSVCAEDKASGEVYAEQTKVILTISEGRTVDKTQKSAVPDFVGSTVDHAEEAAEKGGVSLRIAYKPAAGKKDGEIIEQSVKPDEQIDRYDVVTIVIADNRKVLVPYVKGKVMVDANNAITKAGLKPVVAARVYSDTVAAGHVVDQTPGGQTAAERGTEIALTISLGAQSEGGEAVEMPAESSVSESTQTEETHQPSTEETASSQAAESSAGASSNASSKVSSKVSDASQRSRAASSAVSRVTSQQSSRPVTSTVITYQPSAQPTPQSSTQPSVQPTPQLSTQPAPQPSAAPESSAEPGTWQEQYMQAARQFLNDASDKKAVRFELYDLDKDGSPELILSKGAAAISSCEIYTMIDGKIKDVGSYGPNGFVEYCESLNQMKEGHLSWGRLWFSADELKNGEIRNVLTTFTDYGAVGAEKATYKVNDQTVTKEEYDAAEEIYINSTYIYVGTKYELTESNITSVINGWQ